MYYVYKLTNKFNQKYYIGFTNNLDKRMASHKWSAKSGRKGKFYNSVRKYGFNSFDLDVVFESESKDDALTREIELINLEDSLCLNLSLGGEGGFVVPEEQIEAWKDKLSVKRKGRKPALGMKHTDNNKKLFGEFGKLRWDTYGRYPKEVLDYSFKESSKMFGISKTHYYRLLKQAKTNDLG
jgi:group I intron endonuclease